MPLENIVDDISNAIGKIPETIKSLNLDNLFENIKKNIEGTVQDVIDEDPQITDNYVEASSSILNTYGIRQEIVIQNKKEDPKVTALRKLNDNCLPKEIIEVEVLGDINYKVGYGVHVILPFLRDYQDCFMYIKNVSNEWKTNGVFISTLTLTKSRVMDEQEWSDVDESGGDDSSLNGGNSSSATAKSIIALLTQQIGKSYVWGATGPDTFDCSGLMYYCYNQFQDDLVNGKAISRTTYTQLSDGNPVDPSDSSKWQVGDLVFPHDGHVLAYMGNGRFIHAPKTGDVIKTTSQYWSDTYAVRRVIAEDKTEDGDVDLSNATEMNMDLSFYTGAENEGGSLSASGKDLVFGMCASNVYPVGTKFYIKGVSGLRSGVFTVEDTGGGDFNSPNRLDIYVGNGHAALVKANNLGRQKCIVYKLND